MKNIPFILIVLLFLFQFNYPALCQDKTEQASFEFIVNLGSTVQGPISDLETAMRQNNYADVSHGFFGAQAHPYSSSGFGAIGVPWQVKLYFNQYHPYYFSVELSNSPIGETHGYSKQKDEFLFIQYSTKEASVKAYTGSEFFRFGLGPAIYLNELESDELNSSTAKSKFAFGVEFCANLHILIWNAAFINLELDYRLIPRLNFGDWEAEYETQLTDLSLNFSHLAVWLGAGFPL